MKISEISEAGALAIATTIKAAVFDIDRNRMVQLHRRWGGIGRITKVLVAAGFMTRKERFAALATMPRVNNPSLSYKVR